MVAVKNLIPMTEVQDTKFKYEVDNLMRVRHQNIIRFVGYCYETRMKYIEHNGEHIFAETPQRLLCFEYVPNGSLDRYISGMIIQDETYLQGTQHFKKKTL
jgi:serine/threonine protein kinase